MMTSDWAWIGPLDVIRAEEHVIPGGDLRLQDAKQALSGWLYIQDDGPFPEGFVEESKLRQLLTLTLQTKAASESIRRT